MTKFTEWSRMMRRFAVVVIIVFVYVCYYVFNKSHLSDTFTRRLLVPSLPTEVHAAGVGRRPDDGVWYNFSVPPALLFFAYSAFVDLRTAQVVRIIAISTKSEDQLARKIKLFCVFNYKDGRPATVSSLFTDPSPIGLGYPLYGIAVREYVYACPLTYSDSWPVSLTISTAEPRRQYSNQSAAMPVEVPARNDSKKPLAVCVQAAYGRLDPVRLVEWLEFQRLLGVSFIGVYLCSDVSQSAEKVFRYYADVDGLVDLRRTDYISRVVGGSTTSFRQYALHWSPIINDCLYRNMFRFSHIAIIDFDEVIVPHRNWIRLTDMVHDLHRNYSSATYVFRNNFFFLDLPAAPNETVNVTFVRYRQKTSISPQGFSDKSVIDPKACVNMHNHYCWGFINNTLRHHYVDPDVAVLRHYKPCPLSWSECRQMMNDMRVDDTVLKYRAQLATVVSQKLANVL